MDPVERRGFGEHFSSSGSFLEKANRCGFGEGLSSWEFFLGKSSKAPGLEALAGDFSFIALAACCLAPLLPRRSMRAIAHSVSLLLCVSYLAELSGYVTSQTPWMLFFMIPMSLLLSSLLMLFLRDLRRPLRGPVLISSVTNSLAYCLLLMLLCHLVVEPFQDVPLLYSPVSFSCAVLKLILLRDALFDALFLCFGDDSKQWRLPLNCFAASVIWTAYRDMLIDQKIICRTSQCSVVLLMHVFSPATALSMYPWSHC